MLHDTADWLFDNPGSTPQGLCLAWEPGLIWLQAVADAGIALAYLVIPLTLLLIGRQRPDLVFRPLIGLFAAFFLLCGAARWIDLLTLWVPAYGLQGLFTAAAAIASMLTAATLWWLMPRMLALPSPAQLRHASSDLANAKRTELFLNQVISDTSRDRDELAGRLAAKAKAERELRESEERFRLLLHSNVTEALYLLDPEGNIESWNAGAERIKGYTAAEIIGRNFSTFFTPEDIAGGEPARALANARDSGHFTTEAWRVRKDGSRFVALIAIDAIRRDDGSIRGFVKVTHDITERRIEDEQRAIIVEAAPNGMLIVDEAGIITLANSQVERIFEYPPGALNGRSVEIVVPDAFRAPDGTLRKVFESRRGDDGASQQRQFTGRKMDGSAVTIEIMMSPVRTPRGNIVVASLFDVTERVNHAAERHAIETRERLAAEATNANLDRLARHLAKARDRAELASQAKSRFLAGITHELRTPLHGILGYAELLSLEGGLSPTQTERLEVMMASGQHLLGLINSVLDMSQIEAEQLELSPSAIELPGLVRVCLDVVRPGAEAKGLALVLAPISADTPLALLADPTRLRQVLINLLGNAVKFTPTGMVEMRLLPLESGAWIRLEVADTGPGIRSEHREKLFQTFERLNAEAVSGIEGAGLGLAIAARLVQLMGGRIGYANNPGGGSVFWLELPAIRTVARFGAEAAAPNALPAGPRLRVLVVDDEVLNRSIASGFLNLAGHEVVCVDNGIDAVEAATLVDFDVILMDVRMPGMNGMEATRHIRALPAPRGKVRVVAVTAQAFAQQIEMCREAGMDSHVSKPFAQTVLLAALVENAPSPGDGLAADVLSQPTAANNLEPEFAVFDRAMFDDIAEALPAAELGEHLQTLISRCQDLLRSVRRPGMLAQASELVEDVHRLAGGAGTFGFLLVSAAARRFEVAASTNAADAAAVASQLDDAIEASLPVIRLELAATAAIAK